MLHPPYPSLVVVCDIRAITCLLFENGEMWIIKKKVNITKYLSLEKVPLNMLVGFLDISIFNPEACPLAAPGLWFTPSATCSGYRAHLAPNWSPDLSKFVNLPRSQSRRNSPIPRIYWEGSCVPGSALGTRLLQ